MHKILLFMHKRKLIDVFAKKSLNKFEVVIKLK